MGDPHDDGVVGIVVFPPLSPLLGSGVALGAGTASGDGAGGALEGHLALLPWPAGGTRGGQVIGIERTPLLSVGS